MMKISSLSQSIRITLIVTILLLSGRSAFAVDHAAYRRALVELRAARWLINTQPGGWKQIWPEQGAIKHIDESIEEINRYKITDNKPLNDHSSIEDSSPRLIRLQKALDLLRKVKNDIKLNEDNVFGANMKDRIFTHLDFAISFTQDAIKAK